MTGDYEMQLRLLLISALSIVLFLSSNAFAIETRFVVLEGNLDERTDTVSALPPNGAPFDELSAASQFSTEVGIVDTLNERHLLRVFFFHTSSAGGLYSDWLLKAFVDGDELVDAGSGPALAAVGAIVFDANRKQVDARLEAPLTFQWTNGSSSAVTLRLANFTNLDLSSRMTRVSEDSCIDPCSRGTGQDFDGDGIDDVYIWRPSLGLWAIRKSSSNGTEVLSKQWGLPGDFPMAGDYTGDRLADLVVWRPSNGWWYICPSHDDFDCARQPRIEPFGLPGDRPVRADLDGDGVLDLAVFRPEFGLLFYQSSRTGQTVQQQWGLPGDIPVGARPNE